MSKPRIALIGGGYVLSYLAQKLDPCSFVITSRSDSTVEQFKQNGFTAYKLDITQKDEVENFMKTFRTISTLIDSVPPQHTLPDPLIGTKNICSSLKESNCSRAFYLGTTGVFGVADGSWVDERTPCTPQAEKSLRRVQSEQLYKDLEISFTSFRLSGIYGPGRGMEERIKKDTYTKSLTPNRWSNRVHLEDIVQTLLNALDSEELLPEAFCVSDDKPRQVEQIEAYFSKKLNLELKEDKNKKPSYRAALNQRVSNALLKEKLLPSLKHPFLF